MMDGARLSPHDPRDYQFKEIMLQFKPNILPKVDLRNLMQPIRDQGGQGSCTAFSSVAAREVLAKQQFGKDLLLSPAYTYYFSRYLAGETEQDGGVCVRTVMKAWQKFGCCFEWDFPYNDRVYNVRPSDELVQRAQTFKIKRYYSASNLDEIKAALCHHMAVVIVIDTNLIGGMAKYNGMIMNLAENASYNGRHAITVVGYYDNPIKRGDGFLVVRNSWGNTWANQGYFYLPYEYAQDTKWVNEAWVMEV